DFDYIIANSFATKRQFPLNKNLFCVYNAIDVHHFDLPVISLEGSLKVGMISNNSQRKGLLDFIELSKAAIEEPLLEFFLIGPQNQEVEKIELELKDSPIPPKIHFIDYISESVKAIAMIDVVVNLSMVSESFGRTIAEGMAARRPVIVYQRGAMPELVKHQVTGFLIPPGDLTGVLESLRWLETNRDKARIMGDTGRHFVESTFSSELFQKNLKGIYEHILIN
ncbi:MAG: glycosyltransferase family 4 protein, partial [Saprospiraceae bacterium]